MSIIWYSRSLSRACSHAELNETPNYFMKQLNKRAIILNVNYFKKILFINFIFHFKKISCRKGKNTNMFNTTTYKFQKLGRRK